MNKKSKVIEAYYTNIENNPGNIKAIHKSIYCSSLNYEYRTEYINDIIEHGKSGKDPFTFATSINAPPAKVDEWRSFNEEFDHAYKLAKLYYIQFWDNQLLNSLQTQDIVLAAKQMKAAQIMINKISKDNTVKTKDEYMYSYTSAKLSKPKFQNNTDLAKFIEQTKDETKPGD